MSSLAPRFPDPGYTSGAGVLAASLQHQGVSFMFGIVGIPVIEVAAAAQFVGLRYVGFRNEQSASYAAGAASYLTGVPQVCLCVSGPGVVHGVAGLANAWSNCWPMILIGGASASTQQGMGAFQESPQLEACRPFTKWQQRIDSVARIPFYVARAVHIARSGRPGPVYLEIPAELVTEEMKLEDVKLGAVLPPPPRPMADKKDVTSAISMLRSASRPLVIVGKGAAYSRAEREVAELIECMKVPFLATPMGKGAVRDDHPLSVAAARSYALQNADCIVLLGARLNWILHFGLPPRFSSSVKIIQVDIAGEELHTNVQTAVGLVGDVKSVVGQLVSEARVGGSWPEWKEWRAGLQASLNKNNATVAKLMSNDEIPMSYYRVFRSIRDTLPKDCIIVSEGANTMDIGRGILLNYFPRHRLDAGTFGTMGVGLGFAIAAAMVCARDSPSKRVVCIEGDSAFGFSGMEFETAARYKLPITFIIVNNSGIYAGLESDELPDDRFSLSMPVTQLSLAARYEKMALMVGEKGARGYLATTPQQLEAAVKESLTLPCPSLINVIIKGSQERKAQPHAWLTTAEQKRSKL